MSPFAVERDSRGRERLVRRLSTPGGHGRPRGRSSYRDELLQAEARIEELEIQNGSLLNQISFEQSNVWEARRASEQLGAHRQQYDHLAMDRNALSERCDELDELLGHEERKHAETKDKYRMLKRAITQSDHQTEGYKARYEETLQEVEVLRLRLRERDELIRLNEDRIADKDRSIEDRNRTIKYLRNYLRSHGFRVEI